MKEISEKKEKLVIGICFRMEKDYDWSVLQ